MIVLNRRAPFEDRYSIDFTRASGESLEDWGSVSDFSFIQNTGVFTVSTWAKMDNNAANAFQTYFANLTGSADKGFFFGYDNRTAIATKQIRMSINRGGGGNIVAYISSTNAITDNDWHHIAIIGNGTSCTGYVDTVSVGTSAAFGALSTGDSTRVLDVADDSIGSTNNFDGRLHRTVIINTNLSAGQLTELYNTKNLAMASFSANIVGWLRMGNKSGDVIDGSLGDDPANRINDMIGSKYATPSSTMVAGDIVIDSPH